MLNVTALQTLAATPLTEIKDGSWGEGGLGLMALPTGAPPSLAIHESMHVLDPYRNIGAAVGIPSGFGNRLQQWRYYAGNTSPISSPQVAKYALRFFMQTPYRAQELLAQAIGNRYWPENPTMRYTGMQPLTDLVAPEWYGPGLMSQLQRYFTAASVGLGLGPGGVYPDPHDLRRRMRLWNR